MIECVKKFKEGTKNNKLWWESIHILESKIIYEQIKKMNQKKEKIELFGENLESVMRNNMNNKIHSELQSFNYKVIHNAIYTLDKFSKMKQKEKKCFLCKKYKETCKHVFGECEETCKMYNNFCKEENIQINNKMLEEEIIEMRNKDEISIEKISIFKIIIWKIRNMIKHGHIIYEGMLKDLYNSNFKRYSLISNRSNQR